MEAEYLFAEESYGEDSLKSQYLIAPGRRELRKERLYEDSSLTSINKFIKVKYCTLFERNRLIFV